MRSDVVLVNMQQEKIEKALAMLEKTAVYCGFDAEYSSQLRRLGEELIRVSAKVLENIDGQMWVESDRENLRIQLKMEGVLSEEIRAKLLSVSKSGKNEAHKGVLGRISTFLDNVFLKENTAYALPMSLGTDEYSANSIMSMSVMGNYEYERAARPAASAEADSAGDEKVNLTDIADDITVSVRAHYAQLTVIKRMPD